MSRSLFVIPFISFLAACSGTPSVALDAPDAAPAGDAVAAQDAAPGEDVTTTEAEAGPLCTSGLVDCDGTCRDLRSDTGNCGACGNVCNGGEPVCAGGSCECATGGSEDFPYSYDTCDPTLGFGSGGCVICDVEIHKCVTRPDYSDCLHNGQCCGAACVALDLDPQNCGVCGGTCDIGESCLAWQCCSGGDSPTPPFCCRYLPTGTQQCFDGTPE